MVDPGGRSLELFGHPADVQDRDDALPLLKLSRGRHLFVKLAYAGVEIVRKFADHTDVVVQPRRQVVERTFAGLNRNRRVAKAFEHSIRSRYGISLRRFSHAPHPPHCSVRMRFETGF